MINKKHIYCRLIFVKGIIFSAILFSGCAGKTVDEDKFAKVYAEMVVAQDTANYSPNNFRPVQEAIFKRYGITRGEYTATVDSYNKDPQKWEKFFDKAIAYVDTLKKKHQPVQSIKPK